MGFYERAKATPYMRAGQPCRIETLLDDEPEDWADYYLEVYGESLSWADYTQQVREAFTDPKIGPGAITRLLKQDRFVISEASVARHNREQCLCPVS